MYAGNIDINILINYQFNTNSVPIEEMRERKKTRKSKKGYMIYCRI